jgi:hypothetical protein
MTGRKNRFSIMLRMPGILEQGSPDFKSSFSLCSIEIVRIGEDAGPARH